MPFPDIKHCLVCKDIQQDPKGSITVIGFYGISPYVQIDTSFKVPTKLMFALGGPPSDGGRYRITWDILDPTGNVISEPSKTPYFFNLVPGRPVLLNYQDAVLYPGPGEYRVRLTVDGKPHYEASFQLFPAKTAMS